MAFKYISIISGVKQLIEALVTSTGAPDAGKIPALDASGKIDVSLLPTGVGPDVKVVVSSENLAAGDFINIWNDTGTPKARKADATVAGKEAVGFVLASVTAPANASVYMEGTLTGLTGLTIGTRQYLSTIAGGRTEVAPSAPNNVVQYLGRAISATELSFEPDDAILIA